MSLFIFLITLIFRLRITVAQKSDLNSLKAEVIPLQQCECVPFYKCNSTYEGNIVYGTKCADNSDVCCKPEAIVENSTPSSHQPTQPTTITECPEAEEKACCTLPPPQQNGTFSPSIRRCPPNNTNPYCQMTPGNIVPHNWVLFHSCDPGYVLNDTNLASVCLDGQWRPPLPRCNKLCVPSYVGETTFKCEYKGMIVSCDSPALPGTVNIPKCPQFYKANVEFKCEDSGEWTQKAKESNQVVPRRSRGYPNHCIPECGMSTSVNATSPCNLTLIERSGPWSAAIYSLTVDHGDQYSMECYGTLVSDRYVLTAAGCVTSLKKENIRVGLLGKSYHHYFTYITVNRLSVIAEVEKVIIHESYKPEKMEINVALLQLLYDVPVTEILMPVCLNSKHGYTLAPGTLLPVDGMRRVVSGNRIQSISYDRSQDFCLKITETTGCSLPSTEQTNLSAERSCVPDYPVRIVNHDKIISGFVTTFQEEGRHFIKGIITNNLTHVTFTDVTVEEIFIWLKKNLMK